MEEYVIILDYLPNGLPTTKGFKRESIAYGIGVDEFKLFELIPKPGINLSSNTKTYIGREKEKREHILSIKKRINYNDLTQVAKGELIFAIERIVLIKEKRFVDFFNDAQPISTRFHTLELLPGLGKKTMWSIVEERGKKRFESFEDLCNRVKSIHHPEKIIAKRIDMEMEEDDLKYRIFIPSSSTQNRNDDDD